MHSGGADAEASSRGLLVRGGVREGERFRQGMNGRVSFLYFCELRHISVKLTDFTAG